MLCRRMPNCAAACCRHDLVLSQHMHLQLLVARKHYTPQALPAEAARAGVRYAPLALRRLVHAHPTAFGTASRINKVPRTGVQR